MEIESAPPPLVHLPIYRSDFAAGVRGRRDVREEPLARLQSRELQGHTRSNTDQRHHSSFIWKAGDQTRPVSTGPRSKHARRRTERGGALLAKDPRRTVDSTLVPIRRLQPDLDNVELAGFGDARSREDGRRARARGGGRAAGHAVSGRWPRTSSGSAHRLSGHDLGPSADRAGEEINRDGATGGGG